MTRSSRKSQLTKTPIELPVATQLSPAALTVEENEDKKNFAAYLEHKKRSGIPESTKAPIKLIRCKVARFFCDGNTTERFKELGYPVEWPAEQVRDITVDLYNACVSSGARIEIVPEAE